MVGLSVGRSGGCGSLGWLGRLGRLGRLGLGPAGPFQPATHRFERWLDPARPRPALPAPPEALLPTPATVAVTFFLELLAGRVPSPPQPRLHFSPGPSSTGIFLAGGSLVLFYFPSTLPHHLAVGVQMGVSALLRRSHLEERKEDNPQCLPSAIPVGVADALRTPHGDS